MAELLPGMPGCEVDDPTVTLGNLPQWTFSSGRRLKYKAQTGNTVAGNVANQGIGTNALPAVTNGTTTTQVVNNTLVTAASIILCQVRRGTTTPAAGALASLIVEVTSIVAGTSFTVTIRNVGTAATLSTDYQLWYMVLN